MNYQHSLTAAALLSLLAAGCGSGSDSTPPSSAGDTVANDTLAPVISLIGESTMTITVGDDFSDPGSTVSDNVDSDLVAVASGAVDNMTPGSYVITYMVSDVAGNEATATRTVVVEAAPISDSEAPVITLNGESSMTLLVGNDYQEPGATVTDNVDTGLVAAIAGSVDTTTAGTYTVTYSVSDAAGNQATATRTVIVNEVVLVPPPIEGNAYLFHSLNDDSYYFEYWGDTWGTNTQYTDQPADTTYAKALELTKSASWGTVVAWGNDAARPENFIDVSAYTHARFKVKSDTFTGVQVFVQSASEPELNVSYDFAQGTDLGNGWTEMEVLLSGVTDMTWFSLNFIGDSGTVLLADLYFTTLEQEDAGGPAMAAPMSPQFSDEEVVVLYSDSLTQDSFIGVWRADWWNAPLYSEGDIGGDHYAQYEITAGGTEGGVAGLEYGFEIAPLDASAKTTWNFDMYVESGIRQISLQLVSTDGGATYVINNPATDTWVSWDIFYSEMTNNAGGVLNPGTLQAIGIQLWGDAGQSVYLDNIYFSGESLMYDLSVTVTDQSDSPVVGAVVSVGNVSATSDASGLATLTLPEGDHKVVVNAPGYGVANATQALNGGNSSLAISIVAENPGPVTAAPVPTVANEDALVLYSDALAVDKPIMNWADNWWNAPTFSEVVVGGDNIAKLQIIPEGTAGGVVGIQYGIESGALDASMAAGIRFDMFATSGITQATFQVVPSGGDAGVYTLPSLTTGQWVTVDIPFSTMINGDSLDTANLAQYGVQLWGTTSDALYLDNIYFYK
ncbi:hypothetical protein GCM10011369_16730 [Neiella marina]|uniref:Pesticidal crystal protein Cry22Aa Ig-like domain-containing protein n=1 Tax=Neiella marina TaxID=508461 RepID=A0A8J2U4R1_9GAMM|nr:immunoglobulin-like domain-containing protein [Neiella marina]GGA75520.1 hypothetical protein GCM10011369_16730 [Neiella marina]